METGAKFFSEYLQEAGMLDEVFASGMEPRDFYQKSFSQFAKFSPDEFRAIHESAKLSFFNQGITFAVYSDDMRGKERIFPFDLFPRIITAPEWDLIERGVIQRNIAVNLFLKDLYGDKKILKDKVVPADLIFSSVNFLKMMESVRPPGGIYTHVSGIDLIKHSDGQYYILEDNLRCPSGVSYVITNRIAMKRTLTSLFKKHEIAPIEEYPEELLAVMQSVAPEAADEPNCVVLTPGIYNSAYFEHTFLAMSMGIPVVEGHDLFVENNFVYMKTIYGPQRVDVIYRRVDDSFLDPDEFNPDSVLGVRGLMQVYRDGNVTLLNAPGTGVADDKAVYIFMPQIIKYYLGEEPILNNVYTYRCELDDDYKYVMENMDKLVIKPVDESGGYGILIGSKATKEEISTFKDLIKSNRRKYIAQPVMSLTTHATYIEETCTFEPRHIDLRVFSLYGKNKNYVLKGGLSRVALRKGSLIVNSSQGGGSKDTWVLEK